MVDRVSFILKSPADRAKATRLVNGVSDGSRFEVKAPRRSNEQNDKMWPMLADISEQVEWYGYKLTDHNWKDIFTSGLKKTLVVPDLEGTGFVMLGLHSSDLTKQEFSDLIELIYKFGAEHNVKWSNDTF
jgi:hypothetical protein